MRLPESNNPGTGLSAGEEFVKKIGLLGAILFLVLSIIGTILMLVAGRVESHEQEPDTNAQPPSACSSLKRTHGTIEIASDVSSLFSFPRQLF